MPERRKSLSKLLRSKEEFIAHMRAQGMEADLRQDGWGLSFAAFPITDADIGPSVGVLSSALKDHFIRAAAGVTFSSRTKQITFMPAVSDLLPTEPKTTKVSHRYS